MTAIVTTRRGTLPRAVVARARVEFAEFYREPSSVFFALCFPVVMYVIFASVFSQDIQLPDGASVGISSVYLAGMLAVGLMTTGFQSTVSSLAQAREQGSLRRLSASPMPRSAHLLGYLLLVVFNVAVQAGLLLLVASSFFHADMPHDWAVLGWVTALGSAACTVMGIAFGSLLGSGRAASTAGAAVTNVLAFVSGCYIPPSSLPGWMQHLGELFPLAWIARGLRSSILPEAYATGAEPGGSWQLGQTGLVLVTWTVVGLVVALRTFRWSPRDAG